MLHTRQTEKKHLTVQKKRKTKNSWMTYDKYTIQCNAQFLDLPTARKWEQIKLVKKK